MTRSRSKSDAELATRGNTTPTRGDQTPESDNFDGVKSAPTTPHRPRYINDPRLVKRRSHYGPVPPTPQGLKRHSSTDDKWIYKGKVDLVDMDVVVGTALEDERRIEVLSPEGSFVLYGGKTQVSCLDFEQSRTNVCL